MTKRHLLLALLAISAVSISAQPVTQQAGKNPIGIKDNRQACLKSAGNAQDMVTEQPEGRLVTYQRQGGAFYNQYGFVLPVSQDKLVAQVVYADDGRTVWLQDIVSQAMTGVWVKGELSDDGQSISVPLGQYVYHDDYDDYGLKLALLYYYNYEEDGVEHVGYMYDETATEVTYTVDGNCIILDGAAEDDYILGLIFDDTDSFAGYGDYSTVYSPFTDQLVELPEGLTPVPVSLQYWPDAHVEPIGFVASMATDGHDLYLQGLFDKQPDSWVKGHIEGDKAVIPSGQFLGMSYLHPVYFMAADTAMVWSDFFQHFVTVNKAIDSLVLDYDAEGGTLKATQSFATNMGKSELYEINVYAQPLISPYADEPATPADPYFTEDFTPFEEWLGYGYIYVSVPELDTNGNFIDPAKLYYKVYMEGEEFVFSVDDYWELADFGIDELAELPHDMNTGDEIYHTNTFTMIAYFQEVSKFGLQSVYYGGGERRVSNIVEFDTGIDVGISAPAGATDRGAPQAYTLLGTRTNAQRGISIVRQSDGSVRKVIVK